MYRIPDSSPAPVDRQGRTLRAVLWLVVVVSAAANATTSLAGLSPVLSVTFGVATVLCVAGLVVHHVRRRQR
jgi:hypothetical protein